MKKIIIDTDIGDDIDDAFALALAAHLPEAELVGVTTVFRNTEKRVQLAKKLLQAMHLDVPVYAGESLPVREPIHPFEKDVAPYETALPCQWEKSYECETEGGAVDFLIESAERYGKELTVVAIGPMTNLGRAFERAPESMKKIERVVSMGGRFLEFGAEWNILCDPEAADTVYRSGVEVYAVGLDVTLRCPLQEGLLQEFVSSPRVENKLLALWLDRWFKYFGFEKSVLHDPLALASVFYPLCKFERKNVKADLENVRGAIHVCENGEGTPVYVATDVDAEAFYRVLKQNLLD